MYPLRRPGTTGEAIADRILSQWQLFASQLCGQTYNGAGAMAGKRGAAARITDEYPKVIYTHCTTRALILCVVKC